MHPSHLYDECVQLSRKSHRTSIRPDAPCPMPPAGARDRWKLARTGPPRGRACGAVSPRRGRRRLRSAVRCAAHLSPHTPCPAASLRTPRIRFLPCGPSRDSTLALPLPPPRIILCAWNRTYIIIPQRQTPPQCQRRPITSNYVTQVVHGRHMFSNLWTDTHSGVFVHACVDAMRACHVFNQLPWPLCHMPFPAKQVRACHLSPSTRVQSC